MSSTPVSFNITNVGNVALWNANNTGLDVTLTHIQLGSGNRTPDGTETALTTPEQSAPIAAGTLVSDTQIRMSAIFTGSLSYTVKEIGLWAGDPTVGGSVLVAYWSQASGLLAVKSAGVDFVFAHDMTMDNAVPPGTLTISADTGQSSMLAMMADHESAANPHGGYATKVGVQAQTYTAITTAGTAPTYTGTASPVITGYAAGMRFRLKIHAGSAGAASINLNGLGAKSLKVYDASGTKQNPTSLPANLLTDIEYDGVDFIVLDALPNPVRIRLSGNITMYVATTGSDSNTGLTAGSPFLTLQKAIDTLFLNYDFAGFSATIQLADGTYTSSTNISGKMVGQTNEGNIVINGNSSNPAAVVVSTVSHCIVLASKAEAYFNNFKLTSSSGSLIYAQKFSTFSIGSGMIFGAAGGYHIYATYSANVGINGSYTISGSAVAHFAAAFNSNIIGPATLKTITLSGTPVFSFAFAVGFNSAAMDLSNLAFTGSATGQRYNVATGASINTNGGGPSLLPGSVAGSSTGGYYT